MDRSFLSDSAVIEASRNFVCVRLMTYESRDEAEFLKSVFVGRTGELENSTFALLSPNGREKLTRAGRSPEFAFRGSVDETPAAEMARTMTEIAKRYGYEGGRATKKAQEKPAAGVPAIADVRLGINVASCDSMPLIVVHGKTKQEAEALERTLTPIAWSDAFRGRFAFVVSHEQDALDQVKGAEPTARILVVRPDAYGVTADVIEQLPGNADAEALAKALTAALADFESASKDPRRHIRKGQSDGVHWDTEIPVSDPGPEGDRPPR